jgi:hypothetical protein
VAVAAGSFENTSWQRIELGGGDGGISAIKLVASGVDGLGCLFDDRISPRRALADDRFFTLSVKGGSSSWDDGGGFSSPRRSAVAWGATPIAVDG